MSKTKLKGGPAKFLKVVGRTPDSKDVVAGVYKFYETAGLPLDSILESLKEKDMMPSWMHFFDEAEIAGMKPAAIIAKLEDAIMQVYGQDFYDVVIPKLRMLKNVLSKEQIKEIEDTMNGIAAAYLRQS